MALSNELKKIKHIYGEDFMKICRESFPTILEDEGALLDMLTTHFANNTRTLAQDIMSQYRLYEFRDFVLGKYNTKVKNEVDLSKVTKTPYELLDEAGYNLYEVTTEEELQSYKKYYATFEELCSFNGGRLNKCICFWAIKKDVDKIKRSNFNAPQREDEYSTSVLSIQFTKHGTCTVSIKSRYNHTVLAPDATFGNDLDKLAPGLEASFKKMLLDRGMNLQNPEDMRNTFWLNHYIIAGDGRYYRYSLKANGAYYCPGNIICRGPIIDEFMPEQVMVIDNFVLDLKAKTLVEHQTGKNVFDDSFPDAFKNIQKIERQKDKKSGETTLTFYLAEGTPIVVVTDAFNKIVEYKNENLTEIGDNFMINNKALRKLELPNVKKVGKRFLSDNRQLKKLALPELEYAQSDFLYRNNKLAKIEVPKLKEIGDRFLYGNVELKEINLPSVEKIGTHFLDFNQKITKIDFPNVRKIGKYFCWQNDSVKEINAPLLTEVDDAFMWVAKSIERVNMPELKRAGDFFLRQNEGLKEVSFPKLERVGAKFLTASKELEKIDVPSLTMVGQGFLEYNNALSRFSAPNLKRVGSDFLACNRNISEIDLPSLEVTGEKFMSRNTKLVNVELPSLERVDAYFLSDNQTIVKFNAPNLKEIPYGFLSNNDNFKQFKSGGHYIDGVQIAQLDKENHVAQKEVTGIEAAIAWFRRARQGVFTREERNDEER